MNPELVSLLGILVAVSVFIFAIFKGYHITLVSMLCMAIIAIFSQNNILATLMGPWVGKFADTYKAFFLLFFFSALFAKSLGDVGAVQAIAFKLVKLAHKFPGHEKLAAVLCLVMIQFVFSIGGISVFVVTFTVLYIAKDLFTQLDVPWKLYTCGTLGASTFTVGMFPGSPQLTNIIPMEYFGTPATAAPVLSLISSALCVILGVAWINHQVKKCERDKEGFEPSGTALLRSWDSSKDVKAVDMPLWKCLLPSVVLFIVLNAVKAHAVAALLAGTVTAWLIFNPVKQFKFIKSAAVTAVQNANQALVALASAAGFGAVVASVSGFNYIISALDSIPGPPAVQIIVAVNVAAAFSASSSTGLKLSLDMLGDRFMDSGIPPAALHRLSSMSSTMLDDLPHSSALANTFYMCKLDYKESYINNFMLSIVNVTIVTVIAAALVTLGLTF
jgi:H+/gluconate symporter-like permease